MMEARKYQTETEQSLDKIEEAARDIARSIAPPEQVQAVTLKLVYFGLLVAKYVAEGLSLEKI